MNGEKKLKKKKRFVENSFSVFEGAPLKPFDWTHYDFFPQNVFFNLYFQHS